ncbi:hypothetical protein QVL82_06310, partial [Cellulosimicrobium funkei]
MTAVTPDQPSVVPAGEPSPGAPEAAVPTPHPSAVPSSPPPASAPSCLLFTTDAADDYLEV